jgi:hypothetical protein
MAKDGFFVYNGPLLRERAKSLPLRGMCSAYAHMDTCYQPRLTEPLDAVAIADGAGPLAERPQVEAEGVEGVQVHAAGKPRFTKADRAMME